MNADVLPLQNTYGQALINYDVINKFILPGADTTRESVKLSIFVSVSYCTHQTELDALPPDTCVKVVIDCKGNISGIDGMQPRYESTQNSSYSPSHGRENPIRRRQAYIRGQVRLLACQ